MKQKKENPNGEQGRQENCTKPNANAQLKFAKEHMCREINF